MDLWAADSIDFSSDAQQSVTRQLIDQAQSERMHILQNEAEEIHGPLWQEVGGAGGVISSYENTLELVIRQSQTVRDPNFQSGGAAINGSDLVIPIRPQGGINGPGSGRIDGAFGYSERLSRAAVDLSPEQIQIEVAGRANGSFCGNQQESLILRAIPRKQSNGSISKNSPRLDGTIVGLNDLGEMQVVNGLALAKLEALNKTGLQMLPGMGTAETGYWNPVIVTDKTGKAKVTFRLPDRSTAWQLQSRAVTKDTLTGESDLEIITKKELFGEIKTPLAFMQGDKANVIVEVHNAIIAKGETINVTFKATLGEKTTQLRKAIVSQGPGVEEVQFPIALDAAEKIELSLSVESGKHKDETTISVPVEPFGLPVYATAAGLSAQNTIAMVGFDKNTPAQNPQMEILVGPTINRALIEAVLGSENLLYRASIAMPESRIERAVSDVLGGTAVLAMLGKSQTKDSPEAQALAGRVQSAIASLVSSQREDGGWSWSGRPEANASDRYLSSRAVWALAEARKAGFAVPQETWTKAVEQLKSAFTASPASDREGQAILLHGLTTADAGDFAFANRLYRERNSLSPSGLLHLALALIQLDRKSMAEDLLKLVKLPVEMGTANSQQLDASAASCIPWMQSNVELRALYLLALEDVTMPGTNPAQVASWLMAARQGTRWTPEKVNGSSIAAPRALVWPRTANGGEISTRNLRQ